MCNNIYLRRRIKKNSITGNILKSVSNSSRDKPDLIMKVTRITIGTYFSSIFLYKPTDKRDQIHNKVPNVWHNIHTTMPQGLQGGGGQLISSH